MSHKTEPHRHSDHSHDEEANAADLAEQSTPAFPDPDLDVAEVNDEFPLEADPADVTDQRTAVPWDLEQPDK
jgi:hypothetical protein